MGSILGSKGNKQSNSSSTTPGFTEYLNDTLAQRQKSLGGYSKRNALEDVQGVLQTQATDALQQVMPSIAGSQINAGAYNTTTKDLLRNDATARINAQLMGTQLQAIKDYAAIEQGDIEAFSGATRASTSINSSGSSKGGGSGLLGLFEDGGKVPEVDKVSPVLAAMGEQQSPLTVLLDNLDKALSISNSSAGNDRIDEALAPSSSDNSFTSAAKSAASTGIGISNSASSIDKAVDSFIEDAALSLLGFESGGKVPEKKEKEPEKSAIERLKELFPNNIFDKTRERREKAAGLDQYADGGKVPMGISPGKTADHLQLLEAIRHHANGGKVRSGESDVQAGGVIQGPQTKSGGDNQVIAVGGGEGILAADVMQVPGVEELVNMLNEKFHTPS